jgi:hypothetical protein
VKSEKLRVKSDKPCRGARPILALALCIAIFTFHFSLFTLSVFAQKNEHYNSPLYTPKTYDPTEFSATTGLPETLKAVGIEQKLGDKLPLDVELKDEEGKTVKL